MSQSQIQMSEALSWVDALTMLKHYAEAQRGKLTIGFGEGCEISWPRTTGRDVMAISAVFDAPVRAHAPAALVERWTKETDLVMNESLELRGEQYVGNRSFWLTLVAVAVELAARGVPLPPPDTWNAAIAELASERAPVRNAESTVMLSMFVERTWEEMAARQLEFFRALRGEQRAAGGALRTVPATSNGDVLQLAVYWTEQISLIGHDPTDTLHRLAYSRWDDAIAGVIREAKHAPLDAAYAHNVQFWNALAALADSDAFNEAPAPWAFALPATQHAALRNADPDAKLDLPAAKSFDEAVLQQRDALAKIRGDDPSHEGLLGRIPRTTNSDVRQLAAFWETARKKVGDRKDRDVSAPHILQRWSDALAHVNAIPSSAAPDDTYAFNAELWNAIQSLGTQLAVTQEAPSGWSLALASVKHAINILPDTLSKAIDAVAEVGGKILTKSLGRPLLYLGGGIAAVLVLYFVLRRKDPPLPSPRAVRS